MLSLRSITMKPFYMLIIEITDLREYVTMHPIGTKKVVIKKYSKIFEKSKGSANATFFFFPNKVFGL